MAYPERETVIVDRGSGAGLIVGIIVALAIVAIGYLVFFNGGNAAPTGGTVDIDVPAVSVDVVPDGQ